MCATQLNPLVHSGIIAQYCLLNVSEFIVHTLGSGVKICILLGCETAGPNLGYKIGTPVDISKIPGGPPLLEGECVKAGPNPGEKIGIAVDKNGAPTGGEGKAGLRVFNTTIPKVSNNFNTGTPNYDGDDTTPENSDGEMPKKYNYESRRRRRYSKLPRINDLFMNRVKRRIMENDPTRTTVNIGSTKSSQSRRSNDVLLNAYNLPPNDDWEGFGCDIGFNKHLKEIKLQDDLESIPNEYLLSFLIGFVMNQSIQKLTLHGWPLSDGAILTAFECLNLRTWDKGGLLRMESSLRIFRSLKEFTLDNGEEWECADGVMSSMIGHTGLRKLNLGGFTIRKKGSSALAIMLQSPKFHLKRLDLCVNIDDEGARILADGLSNNGTLEDLTLLHIEGINEVGWVLIFTALQKSTCNLMHLRLNHNYFNDTIALSLSRALVCHSTTLKSLNLNNLNGSGKDITITDWISLYEFMRDPGLALEKLDLSNNPISDAGLAALADALANNKGLKELKLVNISGPHRHICCSSISTEEWVLLSKRLSDPDSTLKTLDLSYNSFPDDDALICFAVALVNNHTLETLVLGSPDTTFGTSNSKKIFGTSNIEGIWAFTRDQFLCSVTSLVSSDSEYINSVLHYHLLSCCDEQYGSA
jgi:hypothetical protein